MSADGSRPPDALSRAAREVLERDLPAIGGSTGMGWLLIHVARPAFFVTVAWWHDDVDLRQRYYRARKDDPARLVPMASSAVGCVWQLEVLVHERTAWLRHVWHPDGPRPDRYLADVVTLASIDPAELST